jgi:hypothetical protein
MKRSGKKSARKWLAEARNEALREKTAEPAAEADPSRSIDYARRFGGSPGNLALPSGSSKVFQPASRQPFKTQVDGRSDQGREA